MASSSGSHRLLAFDLGAGSGRAVLGELSGGRLTMREIHRFPNHPVRVAGSFVWDYVGLFEQMKAALARCASEGIAPASIGVDTWGVDFGLLAEDGSVAGQPVAYRDPRTDGMMEAFFALVPRERIYALTGIQFMQLNTLFQLYSMVRAGSPYLRIAHRLLFMPDLFTYLFSGAVHNEYTISSTSQLLDPVRRSWSAELFAAIGIPLDLMPPMAMPGTLAGTLREAIARETGIGTIPVVATAGHDTAAAVAAVPAEGNEWAYISSGTWSLMGVELDAPVMTPEALRSNFTNEGGVGGTVRFLKNIAGLWLLQECKRVWDRSRVLSYDELLAGALGAAPFRTLLDPDAPEFLHPEEMPAAIRAYAVRTGQCAPDTIPQFVRCILESLALKYRLVLDQLRALSPRRIAAVHVIGGGSRNALLCQFTADSTGLPVAAGPAEATAAGNIMVQALATGMVESVSALRDTVRHSSDLRIYSPEAAGPWDTAYRTFTALLQETAGQQP